MRIADMNFEKINSPFEHKIYCNQSDTIMVRELSKTDLRVYSSKNISYRDLREIVNIFFRHGVKAYIEINNECGLDNKDKKMDIKIIGIEDLR